MKAVLVKAPFQLEIAEIPTPTLQTPSDVVVKVTSGGICGSDIGIYDGTNALATYPRIIGHEFGGIVTEIGTAVTTVKVGDSVAVDPVISCGHCYACRIGRHNVCETLEAMGVHRNGGFAEYVMAPEANIHPFQTAFDPSLLCLVEPYTIGEQINRRGEIKEGDKVLVMGSGPIGMVAMQMAKKRGAQVLMTDIVKGRLTKAKALGADETVLVTEENLEDRLDQFTNGEGIPVIVDCVCSTSSFEDSVRLASPAGRLVVLGLKKDTSAISMMHITKKELTIVGSRLNNYCFPAVIEDFESGRITPADIQTHKFHFTDIQKALDTIKAEPEQVLKVVLTFD